MATRSVRLPDIGEGVAEAEVVEWHVKVGDAVREDQVLAAVMTDKATVEIPSPADGTVTALGVEAGTVLAVGSELVRLDIGGAREFSYFTTTFVLIQQFWYEGFYPVPKPLFLQLL